jgi:hypothetical protein
LLKNNGIRQTACLPNFVMASKTFLGSQKLLESYDEALKVIKQNGIFNKIKSKYEHWKVIRLISVGRTQASEKETS